MISSPFTKEELDFFYNELIQKKERILQEIKDQNSDMGSENRVVGDLADMATDLLEREFTLTLTEKEREMIEEIDKALLRIKNNTYGICIDTKEYIAKVRLEAIPEASRSLKAQEQYERLKKKMNNLKEKYVFIPTTSSSSNLDNEG